MMRAARGKQRRQQAPSGRGGGRPRPRVRGSSPSTPLFQDRFSLWPSRFCFAIGLVVLALVGDEVGQRQAVMRGDEIDACGSSAAPCAAEDVGRAGEPGRQRADHAAVAAPEAADIVAETVVPFQERRREIAELVAARRRCPTARRSAPGRRAADRRRSRRKQRRVRRRSRVRPRPSTGARSKRKPSTPAWRTKWRKRIEDQLDDNRVLGRRSCCRCPCR